MLGRYVFRAAAVAAVVVAVVEGCAGEDPPLLLNTGNDAGSSSGTSGSTGTSGGAG